jgi:hypothetical protein
MEVGAQDSALQVAFGGVGAVVAKAHPDPAEGGSIRSEKSSPAVVFETDQRRRRQALDLRVDNDVADEALLARLGFHVDQTDAGEPLTLGGLVVVAEKLIAAADGEDRGARLHRALE